MASADTDPDPYLDPGTGILRNLVDAHSQAELDGIEYELTSARALELIEHPPPPTGNRHELQAIHHTLFQDVYAWAGQLRTIDMRKNVPGAELFAPAALIERALDGIARQLHDEDNLRGLDRDTFVDRLMHHYEYLNFVHPFREGNGRTQRLFLTRVAADAGWDLDWRKVTGPANDAACRAANDDRNFAPLRAIVNAITAPAATAPPRPTERVARVLGPYRSGGPYTSGPGLPLPPPTGPHGPTGPGLNQ